MKLVLNGRSDRHKFKVYGSHINIDMYLCHKSIGKSTVFDEIECKNSASESNRCFDCKNVSSYAITYSPGITLISCINFRPKNMSI